MVHLYLRRLLVWSVLFCSGAWAADAPDPENIYNYHPISERLATAGQLFPVQVPMLEKQGVGLVVNLAVANEERNAEEGFAVTSAGISYVQIPVIWDEPKRSDLELFFAVMDARGERNTLVHCFANYRASAFTYLYRVLREGVPEAEAREDMEVIWDEAAYKEYPQWVTFMEEMQRELAPDA